MLTHKSNTSLAQLVQVLRSSELEDHLVLPEFRIFSIISIQKFVVTNIFINFDRADDTYYVVQVNLCQKLLFLHQLTHNMTTDCSWNYQFST